MEETNQTYKSFLEALIAALTQQKDQMNVEDITAFFTANTDASNVLEQLSGGDAKNANGMIRRLNGMIRGMVKKGTARENIEGNLLNMLTSQLKKETSKGKPKGKKKKKARNIKPAQVLAVLEELCRIDAIYDLLSGKLHRLDPVIGDFGCQWRVPFVLDLHDYARDCVVGEIFSGNAEACDDALAAYAAHRENLGTYAQILIELENNKVKRSPNYRPEIQKLIDRIQAHIKGLAGACGDFAQLVDVMGARLQAWKSDEIEGFNALHYLQLCKFLTVNRVRKMDCFGLSGIQVALDLPGSKKTVGNRINQLAHYSILYMDHVATAAFLDEGGDIDEDTGALLPPEDGDYLISGSCLEVLRRGRFTTAQLSTRYETHVFYGPFRSIFMYQFYKGQPIIVDVRRLICTRNSQGNAEDGTDYTYSFNGGSILYFEPDHANGNFVHVPDPTPEQRARVGMCVEAYSVLNVSEDEIVTDVDNAFYTEEFDTYIQTVTGRCSIFDLIMIGGAHHSELPTNIGSRLVYEGGDIQEIALPSGDEVHRAVEDCYEASVPVSRLTHNIAIEWETVDQPVPLVELGGPWWDLQIERRAFKSVAQKFRLGTMEYKAYRKGTGRTQADRITQTVPFAPIHIYGCTYDIKVEELADTTGGLADDFTAPRLIAEDNCTEKED